jgi:hypothetical protein
MAHLEPHKKNALELYMGNGLFTSYRGQFRSEALYAKCSIFLGDKKVLSGSLYTKQKKIALFFFSYG